MQLSLSTNCIRDNIDVGYILCIRNKSFWRFQVVWRAAVGDILPRIRSISRPKQPGSHGVGRFRLSLGPSARLSNLGMQCHDDLLGTGPRRSAQVSNHHRPTDQMYPSQLHLGLHIPNVQYCEWKWIWRLQRGREEAGGEREWTRARER